jgi:hypothetical protein
MSHISSDDLQRVRRGSISAGEAEAIGRHVASCVQCTALAGEALSIGESAAALDAAWETGGEPGDFEVPPYVEGTDPAPRMRERHTHARDLWIGAAAAVAAAFIALAAFFSDRTTEPRPVPVARTEPPRKSVPHAVSPRAVAQMRPEWSTLIAKARATKSLPFPADLRELAAEDALRGTEDRLGDAPVWPAATAVEELLPEFSWTVPAGARSTVTLRRAKNNRVVERSSRRASPHWRPRQALERGATYVWQVEVIHRGESVFLPAPPAPPAIFRVISEREHEELEAARREFPDHHLLLGLLYARAGIAGAARRELDAAPDPLARELAAQLPR